MRAIWVALAGVALALALAACDTGGDGAATAQVWIRKVLGPNLTASDNNSVRTTDAVLTGAAGAEGTQNACFRYGPGSYFIEVVNDGANGENPFVSAEAEGG